MIVSTFNIQNDSRDYNSSKSKDIYDFIVNNKIDVLGLQELFYKCNNDLKSLIKDDYNMVGKYRYFLKMFFPIKNEKNPIITKYKIIKNKTYKLPSIKSKYKRIITKAVIEYKNNLISIYNTHLEVENNDLKSIQLNKIYELLKKDKNLIILMGDFNLKDNSLELIDFINKLKRINIKVINVNSNTFKTENDNKNIDHIFVSKSLKVKKHRVIKDLSISDHYPIIANIEL